MGTLFENVLTASFHGSVVIVAVLILRLVLRNAPKKYLCYLWLLAGIRLLMPFEIQSDLSLQPQSRPEAVIRWETPAVVEPQTTPVIFQDIEDSTWEDAQLPVTEQPSAEAVTSQEGQPSVSGKTINLSALMPYLWAGVAVIFLSYSVYSYLSLRRRVRDAVKIPGGWESKGIETAFILGFIKPRIYIPVGMKPQTRRYILDHERTHLDKGDHWIKMIGFLALALHWFNPLVWVAYILLCRDIEMACDERVVQFMELPERKAYSEALLDCSSGRPHYAGSPVAFGEINVKNRILAVLNYRKSSFWVGLLSVVAIVFVTVCLVTSPTKTTSEQAITQEKFAVALQPPMTENPDWGLKLWVEDISPTQANLYYGVGLDGEEWDGTPIEIKYGYWLEQWNGDTWEILTKTASDSVFYGSLGGEVTAAGPSFPNKLDWTLIYGSLPQGDYRLGIRASRNGQTSAFYTWFHLYTNTLTQEESRAVQRCRDALEALSQRLCMVTVEESGTSGNLSPKAAYLLGTGNGRIDYYSNGVCYSSVYATKESIQRTGWDQPFYPPENAFISFSESDSRSEAQEVCFTAFWADSQGKVYQQTCIYTFDSTGNLSGADLTTRTQGDGNTVLQSRRALTVAKASYEDTQNVQEQPVDSYTAEAESAWGIFFRVDDDLLTDETGDVWMRAPDKPGVSNYTTDSNYWLERKTDDSWEVLESQAGDPSWGEETYRLGIRSTIIDQVDWTPYYGRLEPGLYRMGKRFSNGQETTIQYAEFQIRQRGQVTGEGGEEALARLKAEIDRICAGNYCIEQQSMLGQGNKSRKIYWKYDGVCVTDYYNGEGGAYSHSSVTYANDVNADLFYDEWWYLMEWDHLYNNVFFTDQDAITDSRITFQVGGVGSSLLRHVEVQFDENGRLTQAEVAYIEQGEASVPTILTVTEVPEEEIRSHVEQIVAENAEA